ncbi:MAG TPA: TRAP transporter small permease, partial [Casimicrobiaceae bacterium]|nr:TRAP transporter small permease [Casimicrobiaceae bacterium]
RRGYAAMSTHPQAVSVASAALPAHRDALEAFRAGYGRLLEWLVSSLMIILFVEVTAGVVFRGIGQSLIWYDEIASVLLAWLTFYGAALASTKRAHIGCPELLDAMPPRPRRAFNIVAQLLVIGFFALLGYVGASIMPILATDALVSVPEIPMSIVQSVIPISSLLIIVAEGIQLVALIRDRAPVQAPGAALSDALH